jgi:hypothetical protein
LTATQTSGLSRAAVAQLTDEQVGKLSAAAVAGLSQAGIAGLGKGQIRALSVAALNSLSATQIGGFSSEQAKALTSSQLNGLSQANLNALDVGDFTTAQLQGLSGGPTNLTTAQVSQLSQVQLVALDPSQLGSLGGNVSALSTQHLAQLSAQQTASLLATQANSLSVAQISTFTDKQLSTTTVVGATNGLQFNLSWGSSTANAPAGFRNAVVAAAAGLSNQFGNNTVVNIQVGYGEVAGSPVSPGAAAQSVSYARGVSYSALATAILGYAGNSAVQGTAAASLSGSDPTSGGSFAITTAEAKALGINGASANLDGYIGLSSAIPFEFNQNAVAGKYDAIGAIQHEFSEVMGRISSVGAGLGPNVYTPLDLFRYTSTNNADPSAGTPIRALTQQSGNVQYFSINNGNPNLGGFNSSTGAADYGDWNATMGTDPFGFSFSGVTEPLSGNDVVVMAALGWNPTAQGVTHAQAAATYALV